MLSFPLLIRQNLQTFGAATPSRFVSLLLSGVFIFLILLELSFILYEEQKYERNKIFKSNLAKHRQPLEKLMNNNKDHFQAIEVSRQLFESRSQDLIERCQAVEEFQKTQDFENFRHQLINFNFTERKTKKLVNAVLLNSTVIQFSSNSMVSDVENDKLNLYKHLGTENLLFCYLPENSNFIWQELFTAIYLKKSLQSLDEIIYTYPQHQHNQSEASNQTERKIRSQFWRYLPSIDALSTAVDHNWDHRFISVRHPFLRVYDFWKNHNSVQDQISKVSFENFLSQTLLNEGITNYESYSTLCSPCLLNYDLISRHETQSLEYVFIAKTVKVGS